MNRAAGATGVAAAIAIWLALAPSVFGDGAGGPSADSAAELMAKVAAARRTRGFTMRARLIVESEWATTPVVVVQIRAVGRRDGDMSRVLYQALGPDALKGRAVVLEQPDRGAATGFLFAPPETVTAITRAELTERLFDSDLTVEDLADDHIRWPRSTLGAEDKVGSEACRIVESTPPKGAQSSYARVRSCVSTTKLLILRLENLRADGHVAKRVFVRRTARSKDGVVVPRTVEIEDIERGSKTTIEVSRGDRDVVVASTEFSVERLKRLK
jgi:hypothetical protein